MNEVIKVPIDMFDPNPYQPRSRVEISEETAEYYGKSILEHGLLQIPLAREAPYGKKGERYEMGDGWLRLQGHIWLVKKGNTAFNEIPVEVRAMSDEQMAHLVFEANGVRKDLEPIEKAKFFQTYIKDFKVSEKLLAKKFGISQGEISNTLRLLQLPEEIQKEVSTGKVPQTHARQLLRLKDKPEKQKEITQQVIKGGVTVNELAKTIDEEISPAVGKLTHGPERVDEGKEKEIAQPPEIATEPEPEVISCTQATLETIASLNSADSLTLKPPQVKAFELDKKFYVCTSNVSNDKGTIVAEGYQAYQVDNFKGMWGSYKEKDYILFGQPIKFVLFTEDVEKKKNNSKKTAKKKK